MALTGQVSTQAPQSMQPAGSMKFCSDESSDQMQSTGQTSTQVASLVPMQGCVMTKAMVLATPQLPVKEAAQAADPPPQGSTQRQARFIDPHTTAPPRPRERETVQAMSRSRSPLRRYIPPALVVAAVMVYGTAGYMLVERWGPLDAFFMTLISITTVGFDEVHPLDQAGKVFTSTLLFAGVGTIFWSLGIFTESLTTGELGEWRRRRATEAQRRKLHDHFIICGYGRMGTQIVLELADDGVPFVVIEDNPEALARLRREGRPHIDGDAALEDVLREAGITRARGLISAVDADERAVYVVLAARALNPDLYVLSRAGQPDSIRRLELAGADRVVSPYRMAGHQLAALAVRPATVEVMEMLHGGAAIGVEELVVPARSPAAGRPLESSGLFDGDGAQLLALRRADGTMHVNPGPELVVQEGDLIVALGSTKQLEATAAVLSGN